MRTLHFAPLVIAALAPSSFAQITGPTSSQSPYLLPVIPDSVTVSLITVGDSVHDYRMCGIPDGIGLAKRSVESRLFAMVVNHEFGATSGIARAHGSVGSFVSMWVVDPTTKSVKAGRDLIQSVVSSGSSTLGRFCSGDLADRRAFFQGSALTERQPFIYLNGEEVGDEGRGFAHIVSGSETGMAFDLPYLGKFSWENSVARPYVSPKTVVIGLDDSTPGQVYVYVGDKQQSGTTIQQAGLTGGTLYGVKVPGAALEDRTNGINGATTFELASLGNVSGLTGAQLQTNSVAAGITEFLRPEDGCFDPQNPRDFYFVTTDRMDAPPTTIGRSRLWRLRFTDVNDVTLGGQITMLLEGTEGAQMMDNLCIDRRGHLIIQEDPGNNAHLAKVWLYDIATDSLTVLLQHDPARFVSGGSAFITQDEESSGVVDASSFLGPGWFICDVQVHATNPDPELVEFGQIVAFFNPSSR